MVALMCNCCHNVYFDRINISFLTSVSPHFNYYLLDWLFPRSIHVSMPVSNPFFSIFCRPSLGVLTSPVSSTSNVVFDGVEDFCFGEPKPVFSPARHYPEYSVYPNEFFRYLYVLSPIFKNSLDLINNEILSFSDDFISEGLALYNDPNIQLEYSPEYHAFIRKYSYMLNFNLDCDIKVEYTEADNHLKRYSRFSILEMRSCNIIMTKVY